VAGRARLISVGRHILVEQHQFAERFYELGSGILKDWRLPSQNRAL
jgi:hypothetical protein